jgi:hypothetical protein
MTVEFDITRLVFLASCGLLSIFYLFYVRPSLSGTSVLIGMILLFHGPAYYYYFEYFGPHQIFYFKILSVAPNIDVLSVLDLAISLGMLSLCLGIYICDRFLGQRKQDFDAALVRWSEASDPLDRSQQQRIIYLGWATVALMLPFVQLDGQLEKVAEYFFSDLDYYEKIALRQDGSGAGYIYRLLSSSFFPGIAVLVLAGHQMGYAKLKWLLMTLLVLVFLAKAAMLSKAPPITFIVQIIVAAMMARSLKLTKEKTFALGTVFLVASLFMVIVAVPHLQGLKRMFGFLFYRVFMVPNEVLLEYFAAIPSVLKHTWGAQFSWLAKITDASPLPPTYVLVSEVYRGTSASTSPAMFMADAWADFSWIGIVLVSAVCGIVFRLADYHLIVRVGRSPVSVAGLMLTHYAAFTAISTSFQTSLLTGGMYLILPLLLYFRQGRRI